MALILTQVWKQIYGIAFLCLDQITIFWCLFATCFMFSSIRRLLQWSGTEGLKFDNGTVTFLTRVPASEQRGSVAEAVPCYRIGYS